MKVYILLSIEFAMRNFYFYEIMFNHMGFPLDKNIRNFNKQQIHNIFIYILRRGMLIFRVILMTNIIDPEYIISEILSYSEKIIWLLQVRTQELGYWEWLKSRSREILHNLITIYFNFVMTPASLFIYVSWYIPTMYYNFIIQYLKH